MSEQDTNTEDAAPEPSASDQQETDRQDTDRQENNRQPSNQHVGGGKATVVASLALIIALGAAVLAVWMWLQTDDRSVDAQVAQLQSDLIEEQNRIGLVDAALDSLQDRLADLSEAFAGQDERLQSLESEVGEAGSQVARTDQRMEEVEQELLEQIHQLWQRDDRQREVDRELDRHLLLIEVAALLRLGQARAELVGDFPGARSAYRRGAALLAQADDPRLGQVRRLLAAELDALEGLAVPDWLAAQARLERLARQVGQWPLAQPGIDADTDSVSEDPQETGWMDNMRSALGQLVRVRPRDETPVSQEQLEVIREALRLRFAAAELALGRRDLTELDHHLRLVSETLNSHFDHGDQAVRAALSVIEEMRALESVTPPAELGGALVALREHMEQS